MTGNISSAKTYVIYVHVSNIVNYSVSGKL